MNPTNAREITYLSRPLEVNMSDHWFEIASTGHFWIERRLDVLRALAGDLIHNAKELAEIGCGNGLLQRQVEDSFQREVTGFDLNEVALRQNVSQRGDVVCYDICEKNKDLEKKFDIIFLFDVLEHIVDEKQFLEAILFHLAPRGRLIINVPSQQWLFSDYDTVVGHQRRYTIGSLRASAQRAGLRTGNWTYWGLPLLPALILRKLWPLRSQNTQEVVSRGFDPGSRPLDRSLRLLSRCEPLPQKLVGTSLMAVLYVDA